MLKLLLPTLTSTLILASVLGTITNSINIVSVEISTQYLSLVSFALLISLFFAKRSLLQQTSSVSAILIFMMVIFCFSDTYKGNYSLINFPMRIGEILSLTMVLYVLNKNNFKLISCIAITTPAILAYCLFRSLDGQILFSDDHATFLYRLQMLKEHFPNIPFYNPLWNAGIDERYFFATGTLNIFFIAAPLIYLVDLWEFYTWIPTIILFLLVPVSAYLASKLTTKSSRAASISSLLAVSSSLGWYHWGLSFGPLGFLTTAALTPLLAALAARMLSSEHQMNAVEAIAIIVTATLVLFWSPGGLIFLPAIVFGAVYFKKLFSKKYTKSILITLFCLNLPWVLVFWSASNVGSFLQKQEDIRKVSVVTASQNYTDKSSQPVRTKKPINSFFTNRTANSIRLLHRNFQTANPIILLLAIPALIAFPAAFRGFYSAMTVWLVFMGSILAPLKPQLELDRMLIVLCIFLSVPVGHMIDKMIKDTVKYKYGTALRSITIAFVLIGVISTGAILRGRTHITYAKASSFAQNLGQQLDSYKNTGRVLFSGFVLHDLDGGHLAPLTTLTKTPLLASSQVHKHWRYKDVIPPEYLGQGPKKIEEYFDLMNVTAVVSTDRTWRSYFFQHSDLYRHVWSTKNYFLFERKNFANNYFLSGNGKIISQESNQLSLTLDSDEAIIKFNYYPFLQASNCRIEQHRIGNSINFIKLSQCPSGEVITIKSKPAYVRITS